MAFSESSRLPVTRVHKHPAIARIWDEAHGWREIQIPWVH
jgi:hypothetical protein